MRRAREGVTSLFTGSDMITVRRATLASVLLPLCLCTGCAGIRVESIADPSSAATTPDPRTADSVARGFRFYEIAPFLLVHTDNKGGLSSQIVYLPDTTRKMSARPYAWGATNESVLKFDTGTLTEASATIDQTVIPKAALDAVKDVLAAFVMAANAIGKDVPMQTTAPTPAIYKIVVNGDALQLIGGPGKNKEGAQVINTSIRVPNVTQK
jgi:hypothetical protein